MNLVKDMNMEELKRAWVANWRMQDKWCRSLERLYLEGFEPCPVKKQFAEDLVRAYTERMEDIENELQARFPVLYLSEYNLLS
jgi:hypothetical protein